LPTSVTAPLVGSIVTSRPAVSFNNPSTCWYPYRTPSDRM